MVSSIAIGASILLHFHSSTNHFVFIQTIFDSKHFLFIKSVAVWMAAWKKTKRENKKWQKICWCLCLYYCLMSQGIKFGTYLNRERKRGGEAKNNLMNGFHCAYSAPFTSASAFLCAFVIQLSILISTTIRIDTTNGMKLFGSTIMLYSILFHLFCVSVCLWCYMSTHTHPDLEYLYDRKMAATLFYFKSGVD